MRKQDAPFSIQIEFTEGCNLMCEFCGIHGIRMGYGCYRFMTPNTLENIAIQIADAGWNSRIELAMHGEPTLNKNHIEYIKVLRRYLPKNQIMMTTNGANVDVPALFDAGLNILAVDAYREVLGKVMAIHEQTELAHIAWYEYPKQPEGNPHKRYKPRTQFVTFMEDPRDAGIGTHSKLKNHCGCADELDMAHVNKRCARPFRELAIRWDGSVALCCDDFRGVYKCGNVLDYVNIEDLWNNDQFEAARSMLYHRQRNFKPCLGCNAISHRVGCLPDKLGKTETPEPNYSMCEIIKNATAGEPYTAAVLRPWEE